MMSLNLLRYHPCQSPGCRHAATTERRGWYSERGTLSNTIYEVCQPCADRWDAARNRVLVALDKED